MRLLSLLRYMRPKEKKKNDHQEPEKKNIHTMLPPPRSYVRETIKNAVTKWDRLYRPFHEHCLFHLERRCYVWNTGVSLRINRISLYRDFFVPIRAVQIKRFRNLAIRGFLVTVLL